MVLNTLVIYKTHIPVLHVTRNVSVLHLIWKFVTLLFENVIERNPLFK